jgi:hypothetical protein
MKEIEIRMVLEVSGSETEGTVREKFLKWVASNGWTCGGAVQEISKKPWFSMSGSFKKTIKGKDFDFELQGSQEEYFYKVANRDHSFNMKINADGNWKIEGKEPAWIVDLEKDLGFAIEEANL